jgi:hypothetical protein
MLAKDKMVLALSAADMPVETGSFHGISIITDHDV